MNTTVYMEHANITVKNLEDAIDFFKTAFPTFKIRGGGSAGLRSWIHLGDDTTYLALNNEPKEDNPGKNYDKAGINHIGFVVSDVAGIAKRLLAKGYKRSFPKQVQKFRIRDYFLDADGNEYEFVEYLSENMEERNTYDD